MGFFFLNRGYKIKPAGSQQTTIDVIRSLLLQDIYTDHCRGQEKILFLLAQATQLSVDITLAFLWSVSYQKLNKPDGAVFWFKVTEQHQCLNDILFKDGNRILNWLHLICTLLCKGGAQKEIFLKCLFLQRINQSFENKRKVGRLITQYMELREREEKCQLWKKSSRYSDNPYSPCDQINIHSWFPDSFHSWCNTWKNFWPGFWHFHLFWEYF